MTTERAREAGPAPSGVPVLTPARLTRFGVVTALAMAASVAIVVLSADGIDTVTGGRVGGDWPPFHAAGHLFVEDPALVLDVAAQREAMGPYLDGDFAPFAYPPILAALFVPFTLLSFLGGYVVYMALLAGAAIWAAFAAMDVLGVRSPDWRRVGLLGVLTLPAAFRSYTGAQNGTITLLVLGLGYRRLQLGDPWRAGLILGLLWYKPQFALPVAGLLLVAGWWRAALASLVPGVALWAATAAVYGADWVQTWWDGIVQVTNRGNKIFNTDASISLVEYLRGRIGDPTGEVIGLLVAAALGLVAVVAVRRLPDVRDQFVVASLALIVTAAHALPYELVLLVPAIGAIAMARSDGPRWALALYVLTAILLLPVHPVTRAVAVLAVAGLWAQSTVPSRVPEPA